MRDRSTVGAFRNISEEEIEEAVEGIEAAVALFYILTDPPIRTERGWQYFESIVKRGVAEAVAARDESIPDADFVDVSYDPQKGRFKYEDGRGPIDFEHIGKKIAAGETDELTRRQLEWFVDYYQRKGDLDPQKPAEYEQEEIEAVEARREERKSKQDRYEERREELEADRDTTAEDNGEE